MLPRKGANEIRAMAEEGGFRVSQTDMFTEHLFQARSLVLGTQWGPKPDLASYRLGGPGQVTRPL